MSGSGVYSVEVEVTAPVFGTEVTDRVRDAITNLFPGAEVEWSAPPAPASGDGAGSRDGDAADDDADVDSSDTGADAADGTDADAADGTDADDDIDDGADADRVGELVGRTHSLERFAERLHEQEILDTAREQFLANRRGETFTFALKKQAAFEGVVNFSVGNPDELGDIHVRVQVREPDVETFVDRVAPPTDDGVPVDPEGR